MKLSPFAFLPIIILLVSCEKKPIPEPEPAPEPVTTEMRQGLPEHPSSIHGYLYASLEIRRYGTNYLSTAFVATRFGDPARDLLSTYSHAQDQSLFVAGTKSAPNVSAGNITFNGMFAGSNGSTMYQTSYSSVDTTALTNSAVWDVTGNKTFVPFKVALPRKIPDILNTLANFSVQPSQGYTVDLVPLISGYDSAAVMLHYNFSFPVIYKSTTPDNSVIVFSPSELVYLNGKSSVYISIIGYNYAHQMIQDKMYVFELSAKLERLISIKP